MCKENKQLATYFGYDIGKSLKIQDNHKLSDVKKLLLDHSNIKRIQDSPIVLKWFEVNKESKPDEPDQENYPIKKKIKKIIFMKVDQNPIRYVRYVRFRFRNYQRISISTWR